MLRGVIEWWVRVGKGWGIMLRGGIEWWVDARGQGGGRARDSGVRVRGGKVWRAAQGDKRDGAVGGRQRAGRGWGRECGASMCLCVGRWKCGEPAQLVATPALCLTRYGNDRQCGPVTKRKPKP
eukprot:350811-Chlamydomonas_euryale.AAC.1